MASAGRLRLGRSTPTGVLLQAQSETFGAWTTASRGGVRLNGDVGFIVSGTPTSWKLRMKPGSGTAAHWVFPGTLVSGWWEVSEGTSALTPMPSSAGRTAKLSDGTYTFELIGVDANGDSNTVEFTRTIDANAVTIGNALGGGSSPGDFLGGASIATFESQTTIGLRKILLAKGIESRSLLLQGFEFTSAVTLRDADPAVPSNLVQLWLTWIFSGAWTRFITVDGLKFDGAVLPSSTRNCKILMNKVSDMTFQNLAVGETVASQDIRFTGLVCEGVDCVRITIQDSRFCWTCIGMSVWGTDITVRRVVGRWLHARLLAIQTAYTILIEDITNLSPRWIPGSGLHPETIQRNDGNPPLGVGIIEDMTIRRIRMYHADATWGAQGIFMGNTTPNSKRVQISSVAYAGWIQIGIQQSTCEDTNRVRNFTLIKANTGDDSTCPPDSGFQSEGPNVCFYAGSPAQWVGTYDVDHGYVHDECYLEPIPPAISDAAPNYDMPTMRVRARVYQAGDFLNGNPALSLPLITFSQWEAMTDDEVVAAYDAALLPGPNLSNADYVTGAFLADGSWNENS